MQYTEKELSRLIEDVEKEFTAHLAKAEEDFKSSKLAKSENESAGVDGTTPLAKAEEEKPAKAEDKAEDKKEASKEEPKSEEKPAAEAKEAPKAEEAPAKEEGKEAPAEAEAAPAADEDGHGYDDEDLEHMHSMYGSMSRGELKAHHDAVKKCLDAHGMEKCGDMAPMAKSESTEVKVDEKPAAEIELLKSEVAAKSAKAEELQKSLDTVTEFLNKLFTKKAAPKEKAITSLDVIAKSEDEKEVKTLTKSEITAVLAKKAADPSLSKSDREAINAYYLNGASIEKISHLLKVSGN